MKTIYLTILWVTAICLLGSCEKELPDYEGPAEMYFFETDVTRPDTSEYSFVDYPERETDTMKITVKLLGDTRPYNRYFKVEVNTEKSTAIPETHFDKLPEHYCLPAGKDETIFGIIIHNRKDLIKQAVFLVLEMKATKDFSTTMPVVDYEVNFGGWEKVTGGVHTLMFSDRYKKPSAAIWSDYYFGKFSQEKLRLMLQELNVSYKQFNSLTYMTMGRTWFIAEEMYDYVMAEAEKGNILKDEDGDPIMFNPY